VHQQPAHEARALRREDARRTPDAREAVRATLDDDAQAGRNDVGVAAQVEPQDLCALGGPTARLGHVRRRKERRRLPAQLLGGGDYALGVRGYGTGRCCGEDIDDEGVVTSANEEVRVGGASLVDLDFSLRHVEKPGQDGRDLSDEVLAGSDAHA
jgi:hypothetical protein